MVEYNSLRSMVSSLAGKVSAEGHDTWRAGGNRPPHRYKPVPLDGDRVRAYVRALSQVGIENTRSDLPPIVTNVEQLPDNVKAADGLTKKSPDVTVVDIMALAGNQLPVERLASEGAATSALLNDVIDTAEGSDLEISQLLADPSKLEALSDREHQRWMEANGWQKDSSPQLFVDYKALPESEKEKDRVRVRTAVGSLLGALSNMDAIVKVGL